MLEATKLQREVPDYIDADHGKMSAKFVRVPKLTEVPYAVQMQPSLVVESTRAEALHAGPVIRGFYAFASAMPRSAKNGSSSPARTSHDDVAAATTHP